MPLDLYMVGLLPRDMEKSLAFYRQLGLELPADSEGRPHVQVQMKGDITFFLNSMIPLDRQHAQGVVLEFYVRDRAIVEAKYAELTGLGYHSYQAPNFSETINAYFAMINDPDGNIVMLTAD
ncbi:VOC family protein [Dictyobacter aurantiacus]|uniref:Glyoxalase n=1 Tax=Dictyobacter aurantiacus TaxID=1936993 RepID=A0A401ZK86_9CHLR|nr:VOC family protein [Dictyobacter aurantiacus]GCE07271.1 glyoxalase [Dictyobacter aurantiacus]